MWGPPRTNSSENQISEGDAASVYERPTVEDPLQTQAERLAQPTTDVRSISEPCFEKSGTETAEDSWSPSTKFWSTPSWGPGSPSSKAWEISEAPLVFAGDDGNNYETRPTTSLARDLATVAAEPAGVASSPEPPRPEPRRRSMADQPISGLGSATSQSRRTSTASASGYPAVTDRRQSHGSATSTSSYDNRPIRSSGTYSGFPERRQSSSSTNTKSFGISSGGPRKNSDLNMGSRRSSMGRSSPEDVLIDMGFDRGASRAALAAAGGDVDKAIMIVLEDSKVHNAQQTADWEFEGDAGWVPFDEEACSIIADARNQGRSACEIKRGGWSYLLDLDSMTQMNLGTKRSRRIRERAPGGVSRAPAANGRGAASSSSAHGLIPFQGQARRLI
eukprot:gnl/MRDRNA2_/MRDRNA2_70937_c0_seq1.p1 gnl/MRDRNA2_/MRDRNA2_70937_c0~~gnl/MRDRNA2_/MRDRNA2_70937_c0_seq1.p1  ORF type:complete len:390 (-),score=50.44 gnl/MRDRNA2_/MRDRNA2_70937_c0_seq1:131-1300(-)